MTHTTSYRFTANLLEMSTNTFLQTHWPCGWWRLCWWKSKSIDVENRILIPTYKNKGKTWPVIRHYYINPDECLSFFSPLILLTAVVLVVILPSASTKQDSVYRPLWNWWEVCQGTYQFIKVTTYCKRYTVLCWWALTNILKDIALDMSSCTVPLGSSR